MVSVHLMIRHFENYQYLKEDGILSPQIAHIAPTSLLIFDHLENKMALLHSGNEEERLNLRDEIYPAPQEISQSQKENILRTNSKHQKRNLYDAVEKAKHHIFEGDIFQIVLSIAFFGSYDLDPFDVYRAMCQLIHPLICSIVNQMD